MDISSDSRRRVLFLILVLITGGATGLRDVRITVPAMVRSRDSALLSCDYDLEGADLYSIKWYHEEEEFYRFVPKEAPPQAIFAVRDIQIDVQPALEHEGRDVGERVQKVDRKIQMRDLRGRSVISHGDKNRAHAGRRCPGNGSLDPAGETTLTWGRNSSGQLHVGRLESRPHRYVGRQRRPFEPDKAVAQNAVPSLGTRRPPSDPVDVGARNVR
ncbi:uncharacterized protein LOC105683032 isoform X2 [Athalia rosae]|uniref:uncharacterized protein LOC105683032 isoform X2 n=1 Tax=Athalia rosae TaxID=37344 RepID=UPI002033EB2A|nr:uncharacterized protein LOC105683032 isoform X2 [Athalia rosae]